MVQALASATFAGGIVDAMMGTFDDLVQYQQSSNLSLLMQLALPTDRRTTQYGYWDTPPGLGLWEQGSTVPRGSAKSTAFNVTVYDWGRKIEWHENDRNDDQLAGLIPAAMRTGESAAYLPEEFAMDALLQSPSILPAIPLAPDGGALFAASVGGVNRFGVAGGNVVTGTGVAAEDTILADFYSCRTRWARMLHRGSRLVGDPLINAGTLIICGSHLERIMQQSFLNSRIAQGAAGATPDNVVKSAGHKVTIWSHPRLTGNTWYACLSGATIKPLFEVERQALRTTILTVDTNPAAADDGLEGVNFKKRAGLGINLPWALLQVTN